MTLTGFNFIPPLIAGNRAVRRWWRMPTPPEIPFIQPRFPLPTEVADEFYDISNANRYTNFGPKEQQFARALGEYLGRNLNVATVANGTLALIGALQATVGPGTRERYLLMPSFTFIAVAQAALWAGYRPWFVDIDPDTWQPSASSARPILERSRARVAGILLTNVFGVGNPQISAWEQLAAQWDLPMIVDSAAGFGSAYEDGERVGGHGVCEIFSFHATKPFGIGEGGAVVSRHTSVIEHVRAFQNFGFGKSGDCTQLGMNGKMQEICAAVGLRQLVGLNQRVASRRKVFDRYRAELAGLGFAFQPNAENSSLCYASVCCSSSGQKAAVLASLRRNSIRAHDYYNPPQHLQPYFLARPELGLSTDLTITEDVCSRIVSLPIHDFMAKEHIARVVDAVQEGARSSAARVIGAPAATNGRRRPQT